MLNKSEISVIILTYNESISIDNTLESVFNDFSEIVILDSYSTDNTLDICKKYTNNIFFRKFDNFKNQRNYAIQNINFINDYIFFLDADEVVSKELINELYRINLSQNDAYLVNRRFYWYGKWLKYGGYYPLFLLRIGNKYKIHYEGIVNEHMKVEGSTRKLDSYISDIFNKPFTHWVKKHLHYSSLEAERFFISETFNTENLKKWNKLPLLLRPFLLFIYRYLLKKGYKLGLTGFLYIFLHTVVYRFFIDLLIIQKYLKKFMMKKWKN